MMKRQIVEGEPSRTLAAFLASLRYEDLPVAVIERVKDLFLDWLGSVLAGRQAQAGT